MTTPALELKIAAKDAEIWDMLNKWEDFKRIHERLSEIERLMRLTEIERLESIPELEEEYCDSGMIPKHYELGVVFGFWTQEDLIEWEC